MKKILLSFIVGLFLISCYQNTEAVELKTTHDSISYALGMQVGMNFKQDSIYLDLDILMTALKDALDGKDMLLDQNQMMAALNQLQSDVAERKSRGKLGENMKFFAENKNKPGVVTTASGLQYKIMKEGSGKTPTENSTVKVHYKGTLLNGQVFDSSYERGKPIEFPVTGVIKGWTEALLLMQEGDKWMLYIPSDLAYGPQARGQFIGPNEALVFEVELLEVIDK